MTSITLAQSYLIKATKRLKILPVLLTEEAYSDVVREAQEIVELAVKGILRYIGIEPPKQHDVGYLLVEFRDRLPEEVQREAGKIAKISKWLRKEREFAFYGDVDFIPTEEYTEQDARRGMQDANFVVQMAMRVILSAERATASQKAGIDCEGGAGGRPHRKGRLFLFHWHKESAQKRAEELAAEGWEVDVEWEDSARGFEKIKSNPPDVVVMDLARRPSHSREAARALRGLKDIRHLPIFFVDGTEEVIARTKTKVTDALYTTSAELKSLLKKFASGAGDN